MGHDPASRKRDPWRISKMHPWIHMGCWRTYSNFHKDIPWPMFGTLGQVRRLPSFLSFPHIYGCSSSAKSLFSFLSIFFSLSFFICQCFDVLNFMGVFWTKFRHYQLREATTITVIVSEICLQKRCRKIQDFSKGGEINLKQQTESHSMMRAQAGCGDGSIIT